MRRWVRLTPVLVSAIGAAGCGAAAGAPGAIGPAEAEDLVRQILMDTDHNDSWCGQWAADVALCRRHLAEYGAAPPTSGRIVATRRSGETVIVTVAHGRRHTDLQVVRDEELLRVIDPVHWSGVRIVSPAGPAATVSP